MAIVVEAPQSLKPKDVVPSPISTYLSNIIFNRLTTTHGILFAVCGLAPVFGRSILLMPSISTAAAASRQPMNASTSGISVIFFLVAGVDFYRAATMKGADSATTFGNAIWSSVNIIGALARKKDIALFLQHAIWAGVFAISGIISLSHQGSGPE